MTYTRRQKKLTLQKLKPSLQLSISPPILYQIKQPRSVSESSGKADSETVLDC